MVEKYFHYNYVLAKVNYPVRRMSDVLITLDP